MEQIGKIVALIAIAFASAFHSAVVGYVAWNAVFVVPYFSIETLTYAQCMAGVFIIGLAKTGLVKHEDQTPRDHVSRVLLTACALWMFVGIGTLALLIVG